MSTTPDRTAGILSSLDHTLLRTIVICEQSNPKVPETSDELKNTDDPFAKSLLMCLSIISDIPHIKRKIQILCSHRTSSLDTAVEVQRIIKNSWQLWQESETQVDVLAEALCCDEDKLHDHKSIERRLTFSLRKIVGIVGHELPSLLIIIGDAIHASKLPHHIAPRNIAEENLQVPPHSVTLINIKQETGMIITGDHFVLVKKIPDPLPPSGC